MSHIVLPTMGPIEFTRALVAAARRDDWECAERVANLMPPGTRAEVCHIIEAHQQRLELYPIPDCRECREGKHTNCDGTTWDDVTDAPADCPCKARGHAPA